MKLNYPPKSVFSSHKLNKLDVKLKYTPNLFPYTHFRTKKRKPSNKQHTRLLGKAN